jgi:hypothetical protein
LSASAALATAPAGVPTTLAERIRRAPTPSRLKVFLYAAWALAGLLFLFGEGSLSGARNAMKTVGTDAAPSIIAAQEISSALADLDANAGNYLLGNSKAHQVAAAQTFEQRRVKLTATLVAAANNITYGEAEKGPINELFDGLGRYLEYYGELRFRKDGGDEAGARDRYTAATDLMHKQLLPAADKLDGVNKKHLDIEYRRQELRSEGAEAIAGVVGAALLTLLVWAQIFLVRRTRRILSLPLLGATAIAAVFTLYLVSRIAVARDDLRIAKEDAFESIHTLWKARSIAFDANGDETRYLLGGPAAASFEQAYHDKVKQLTTSPRADARMLSEKRLAASIKGLFADELRNITFAGEHEAAVKMVVAFGEYHAVDGRIRALEKGGKHAEAVQLCIGLGANESNAVFDRFDRALHEVVEINRREFDGTIKNGVAGLQTAAILGPVASLAIALLALLGIRPRLREYAA